MRSPRESLRSARPGPARWAPRGESRPLHREAEGGRGPVGASDGRALRASFNAARGVEQGTRGEVNGEGRLRSKRGRSGGVGGLGRGPGGVRSRGPEGRGRLGSGGAGAARYGALRDDVGARCDDSRPGRPRPSTPAFPASLPAPPATPRRPPPSFGVAVVSVSSAPTPLPLPLGEGAGLGLASGRGERGRGGEGPERRASTRAGRCGGPGLRWAWGRAVRRNRD